MDLREVGTEGRKFPTIDISAQLHRKPYFYLVNIVVPMSLFALMGNFQFTLPRYDTADRFNLSFSLLLIVVAFKFSMCASRGGTRPSTSTQPTHRASTPRQLSLTTRSPPPAPSLCTILCSPARPCCL